MNFMNITFRTILLLVLTVLIVSSCSKKDPTELQVGNFNYDQSNSKVNCEVNSRLGKAGINDEIKFSKALSYHLRTPLNYDATKGHPLLMVYAPASRSGKATERFVRITKLATESGFIVAYADSQRMTMDTVTTFGKLPEHISKSWCIDPEQIYMTGHSDGGTITTALAFLKQTRDIPSAIAPSGAGMRGADMKTNECPDPLPVMVMHNKSDRHFPDFGAETVKWWVACNQCNETPVASDITGCMEYMNCSDKVRTFYCEGEGSHSKWPELNSSMLQFFKQHTLN